MNNKFFCFDTETTGVAWNDEILSLAIVDQDYYVLFNKRFKPVRKIEWPNAQAVHGISPEDVKDCLPILAYKKEIIDIFSNYNLVIGYNVGFDFRMLEHDLGIDFTIGCIVKDVMLDFARIYGEKGKYGSYKWQKLVTCAKYYNYQFNAHDALEDVKATIYCYKKMEGIN